MPLEQIYINCRLEDFPFELNKVMQQICDARVATNADEEKIAELEAQLKDTTTTLAYEIDRRLSAEAALAEAQKEIDEYTQAEELKDSKTIADLQARIEDLESLVDALKSMIRENHPSLSDAILFD